MIPVFIFVIIFEMKQNVSEKVIGVMKVIGVFEKMLKHVYKTRNCI